MDTEQTLNSQSNLEKEQSWRYHASWSQTILQNNNNQHRMRLSASSQDGNVGRHGSPLLKTTTKLQLKYRTTITQNIRNWVEWKSDTAELKKPHPSRLVGGGMDMEQFGPTPICIKIQEGYLTSEESQTHTRPPPPQPRIPMPRR